MLWMHEIGLIHRIKLKWLPKHPICEGDGRDFSNVGLREIYPLVYIYVIGSAASLVILCIELAIHRLSNCSRRILLK